MALEKLKSVFSDIQPVFEKDISELSTTLGYGESSKIKSTNFIYEYLPDGTGTRVSDQFAPNLNNSPKTSFKIDNTDIFPILDNVQRGSSHQFISEDLTTKFYNIEKFDPRVGRARGPILNINTYQGTRFDDGIGGLFNSSDKYSTAFSIINTPKGYFDSSLGNDIIGFKGSESKKSLMTTYVESRGTAPEQIYFSGGEINKNRIIAQPNQIPNYNENNNLSQYPYLSDAEHPMDLSSPSGKGRKSWQNLYNPDHTPKSGVGYQYPFVDRDKLKLKQESTLMGGRGAEPYIISEIPKSESDILSGRFANAGSREIPFMRTATDVLRLTKFLLAPSIGSAGQLFVAKQQIPLLIQQNVVREGSGYSGGITAYGSQEEDKLVRVPQRFKTGYNPASTLLSAGSRLAYSGGWPNVLFDRTEPPQTIADLQSQKYTDVVSYTIDDTFNKAGGTGTSEEPGFFSQLENTLTSLGDNKTELPRISTGDKMTLAPMIKGEIFPTKEKMGFNVNNSKDGMPFYFKDLRDNSYIAFRGYLEGLTEEVASEWTDTSYVGRSENVYVYGKANRAVNFTMLLAAQTFHELKMIYKKLNRLTSLLYPEYTQHSEVGFVKMKPPLTKMRLGDLYGGTNRELVGFIKGLSYEYPDSGTWETQVGYMVPKQISVGVEYQIIHKEAPSLRFAQKGSGRGVDFYGINSKIGVGEESAPSTTNAGGAPGVGGNPSPLTGPDLVD